MTADIPDISTPPSTHREIERVVALEPSGPFMRLFVRTGSDITFHDHPFRPFVLVTSPEILAASTLAVEYQQLAGNEPLRWLASVENWQLWCRLRDYLALQTPARDWYTLHDIRQQFLARNPTCFFTGLTFQSVKVLCLTVTEGVDIRCATDHLTITVTDGQGYTAVCSSTEGMSSLLQQLTRIIQEQDPDVLTGYNLTRSILPRLLHNAARHQIRLTWGRNGSQIHTTEHRSNARFEVYGRSIIELHSLLQQHHRLIEPLGGISLTQLARRIGIQTAAAAPPDTALQLYQTLAPAWHQLVQQLPSTFEAAVNRPAAAALKTLMLRTYLADNQSLPSPPSEHGTATPEIGQLLVTGQVSPVIRFDISLIKSAILQGYRIGPTADRTGVFHKLLDCWSRAQAPQQPTGAATPPLHHLLFQRLLLPAFYELLKRHSPFTNHPGAAEADRLFSVIIRDLMDCLKKHGAVPVAHDGLGMYAALSSADTASILSAALQQRLTELLPGYLHRHSNQQYQAMFTYKAGCFALLHHDGTISHQGSMLLARSIEPYLREFLADAIAHILAGNGEGVRTVYRQALQRLRQREYTLDKLTRTEKLIDSLEQYCAAVQSGKRNRAAVYELALRDSGRWHAGDYVAYYVTGTSKQVAVHEQCKLTQDFDPKRPDINISWYAERLHQVFRRLEPFLSPEPTLFE